MRLPRFAAGVTSQDKEASLIGGELVRDPSASASGLHRIVACAVDAASSLCCPGSPAFEAAGLLWVNTL